IYLQTPIRPRGASMSRKTLPLALQEPVTDLIAPLPFFMVWVENHSCSCPFQQRGKIFRIIALSDIGI
ncbi:MAG TPA: hypothetical protein VFG36_07705, partial [Methanoregula sp.]|nr:hypothetical protein [Methanoregula sp.]